nr:uncharacterized protein LOC9272321 isoform X2 [Oryza sativa Japonica Group]
MLRKHFEGMRWHRVVTVVCIPNELHPSSSRSTVSNVFPALESLKFRDMGAWEEWSEFKDEHFPQLKYLSIVRCAKLTVLPNFTSGPKQRIRSCEKLLQPLCQNIRRNLMKYIPPPSELSYACMAEGCYLQLHSIVSSGQYSAKFAYNSFQGATLFRPWERS